MQVAKRHDLIMTTSTRPTTKGPLPLYAFTTIIALVASSVLTTTDGSFIHTPSSKLSYYTQRRNAMMWRHTITTTAWRIHKATENDNDGSDISEPFQFPEEVLQSMMMNDDDDDDDDKA
eukprot:14089429-Ditylum_brightwellii.AAC.1